MTKAGMRRALPLLLLVALGGRAEAWESPPALDAVRAAIDAGRLLQARTMLDRYRETGTQAEGQGVLEADLLMAEHRHGEALERYRSLLIAAPNDPQLLTGAGLAALRLGEKEAALGHLRQAVALEGAGWTAWNAIGVLADGRGAWTESAAAYQRALALAPDKAAVWNNLGYSLLLQRRTAEALAALDRAGALDPGNRRIAVNRQVARGMAGHYPRARAAHESSRDWAARLNNIGYAAWLAGDQPAARSLLARAIEASEVHYARALTNLALVEAGGGK